MVLDSSWLCWWRKGMSVAALACGTKTNITVTACAVKLVKVWVEWGENIDLPVLYTVSQSAYLHANERSFSTAIEMLAACVRACVCACARAGPGQRREASLWSLAQQLQSRLMLSQPHVVFSPSLSTAPEASKYLLYCTGRWSGGGGRGSKAFC